MSFARVCVRVMWFCYKINAKIPFFEHDVYSVAIYARFIDVLSFDDADHYTRILFYLHIESYVAHISMLCMKGNPCTACTHTEMCVCALIRCFSFSSTKVCIFHIRLILFFFSCLNLPLILWACLSVSVIVVAPWNSDTCSTMMREVFSVIHIFIHNKSMQIALIRAWAWIGFGGVAGNWMCFVPFV